MNPAKLTASEPLPVALQLKPQVNGKTTDEYMADIHAALGVDHCKFARTWHESTKSQRRVLLEMIPDFEAYRAPGYIGMPFKSLPVEVQDGYKLVLGRFAAWVAARGLSS